MKHVQIFNNLTTFGQGCQFTKCSLISGGIPHPLIKQHPFVAKIKQSFLLNFMYPNVNILALFFSPKNDPICHKYKVPCACQLNLLTLLWILSMITTICDILPILCAINANQTSFSVSIFFPCFFVFWF